MQEKYHEDTHVEVVVVMLTLHNDKKHLATYKSSLCHSEKHDWLLLTCRQRPELYTVPKWKPFQVNYEGALFRPWHMLFCCPEFSQEKGLLSFLSSHRLHCSFTCLKGNRQVVLSYTAHCCRLRGEVNNMKVLYYSALWNKAEESFYTDKKCWISVQVNLRKSI